MLKTGDDLAAWVADLTDRPCESVELLWKPSRQARGVVVYHQGKIEPIEASALRVQRDLNRRAGKPSNVLRAAAERELAARLWVL